MSNATINPNWRVVVSAAMLFLMGHRDDLDPPVQRLLNELCIKLGFCLPPNEIRRLCESRDIARPTTTGGFRRHPAASARHPRTNICAAQHGKRLVLSVDRTWHNPDRIDAGQWR